MSLKIEKRQENLPVTSTKKNEVDSTTLGVKSLAKTFFTGLMVTSLALNAYQYYTETDFQNRNVALVGMKAYGIALLALFC